MKKANGLAIGDKGETVKVGKGLLPLSSKKFRY